MSFHPDTQIEMADGTIKSIWNVNVGDVTKGGKVLWTIRGIETEFYWYGGVLVTGDHLVREMDSWIKVKNSYNGRLFKYLVEVTSNLVTEKQSIWANGAEFADAELINKMGAH